MYDGPNMPSSFSAFSLFFASNKTAGLKLKLSNANVEDLVPLPNISFLALPKCKTSTSLAPRFIFQGIKHFFCFKYKYSFNLCHSDMFKRKNNKHSLQADTRHITLCEGMSVSLEVHARTCLMLLKRTVIVHMYE